MHPSNRFNFAIYLLLCITNLLPSSLNAKREQAAIQPFIIEGNIENCKETQLILSLRDENYILTPITIPVQDGKFFYKASKSIIPQLASLNGNTIAIQHICIAPGFHLMITGNGQDIKTFFLTKNITGSGSISNLYYKKIDSINISSTIFYPPLDRNKDSFFESINRIKSIKDSIFKLTLNNKANEQYFSKLKSLIYLENGYEHMDYTTMYLSSNKSLFDYRQTKLFFEGNNSSYMIKNLMNDDNLLLPDFCYFIGEGQGYLGYIIMLDKKLDTTVTTDIEYEFKKIDESYRGKIKDQVFNQRIAFELYHIPNYESLNKAYTVFKKYIALVNNVAYKKQLEEMLDSRQASLLKDKIGNVAKPFSLYDDKGMKHNLSDYKGQVVFIDLWASWCIPCRKETPYLKKLYLQYKDDNRITFISIAVNDKEQNWKKALDNDKPTWLQLLDNGEASDAFVANEIPKFVLLDKQGKIITLSAPLPSNGNELENILNAEIVK